MIVCALMTALICIFGPLSIPIGAVPISLTNLVIYVAIWILGMKGATISTVLYIIIGLVGLPVFSNGGAGIGKIAGPTGGYILGFILLALIAGLAVDLVCAKFKVNSILQIILVVIAMIIGTIALYALGSIWFMKQLDCSLKYTLTVCVYPFIGLDLLKIALATVLGRSVRYALEKANLMPLNK